MSNSYAQNNNMILITDPRILAVPIVDNQDPMIDLKNKKDIAYGPSPEVPNNMDYTKLRKTVYEKLKQAQNLLPKETYFCLYEGYRSFHLQEMLFANRLTNIQRLYPHWSQEQIFIETTKLISPIINLDGSRNIPPHSTGGAIDVYLVDNTGQAIDMGIHPKDWMKDDGSVSLTQSGIISKDAQNNRKIMSKALSAVDFVNYPTEYWHWSYGDRYWAYHMNQPNAIYGSYQYGP